MDSEKPSFKILMLPWLAHGHIFPYLEFAKRILKKKNFHIYFCTTAVNFTSSNQFIQTNSLETSIELVELRLEPNPNLPPHYHTTKNLPPHLIRTLLEHFQTAKQNFSRTIITLKPDMVIFDAFQPWAGELASSSGIPAVYFTPFGAAALAFSHQQYVRRGEDFPFPELSIPEKDRKSMDSLMEFLHVHVYGQNKDVSFVNYKLSSEVALLKTTREFDGKYIDYVSSVTRRRILAVGPLVADKNEEKSNSDVLQWLSKKETNSTVYISFGSEYFLSEKEIEEIARGLEISGVNFIWVIRFPVMEKVISADEALPEGFLERVGDRGRVVLGWVPQASILGHPSTGAFVSHCGWSSLNESVYYGVPIIGMPMKLIMFLDAKVFVDAGVGVEVVRDENGGYKGDEIAKTINEVIVERGEGLRRRVRELNEKMRMEEEGAIEDTAECLWQLCRKNKGKD